jgi:YjbE family integral membrane protein
MLAELATQAFWIGLLKIIGVNIILSGDNAVVIALAARSLPPKQQKQAVFWGAGAAVVMRIVLTVFAVALLGLPWLKIIGSLLLFWIGIKLLIPEEGGEEVEASDKLLSAIKTILVADLVMSLDNVIAVAAAAGGSYLLLILGLAISIPLVIFGATLLIKLMERFPVIITIGAGLIGWVGGEMLITDLALKPWLTGLGIEYRGEGADMKPFYSGVSLELMCGVIGIVIVVVAGTLIGRRKATKAAVHEAAVEVDRPKS